MSAGEVAMVSRYLICVLLLVPLMGCTGVKVQCHCTPLF